ncbi:MAG: hypothetical protein K1X67_09560 [Fimbriimonadaceae bacterium]|nr:hypothetical protein [Fimbriimonadaceae bacterium]
MTTAKKNIALPQGAFVLGLSEAEIARAYGISQNQFAKLDRRFKPRARRAGNRKLYSAIEAERLFHELPFWDEEDDNNSPDNEWRYL